LEGDVRNQEDARRVIEATVNHFGHLDILVNGAAGNFLASPEDLSPKGLGTGNMPCCVKKIYFEGTGMYWGHFILCLLFESNGF
jgi:NAD(P)-dependent dehydrogenase (short-subunit alcohol dehydrogenase family)